MLVCTCVCLCVCVLRLNLGTIHEPSVTVTCVPHNEKNQLLHVDGTVREFLYKLKFIVIYFFSVVHFSTTMLCPRQVTLFNQ